jgi:hypothetical protein
VRDLTDAQIARRAAKVRELRTAADRLEVALVGVVSAVDLCRRPLIAVRERGAAVAIAVIEWRMRERIRRLRNRADELDPEPW